MTNFLKRFLKFHGLFRITPLGTAACGALAFRRGARCRQQAQQPRSPHGKVISRFRQALNSLLNYNEVSGWRWRDHLLGTGDA
jgi:hypothetical protein